MSFVLNTVMDAIATQLKTSNVIKTAYGWPEPNPTVPCAVVGYPENIEFDMTFKRGADTITFPIWFLVGKATEKSSRDNLTATITGANSIKTVLDGNLSGAIQTGRVTDCQVEQVSMGDGTQYLAAKFTYEVIA